MPPDAIAADDSPRRLRVVVLASGTATMALQMCAVRLLAPWLGASSTVWATIIGLSLLAMSLGYLLGGRLADRRPDGASLARTLGVAGLLVAAIPLVAPHVLPHVLLGVTSEPWTDLVGAGVGYALLFLVPAVLLGATPPYAIRVAIGAIDSAGHTAGRLYALSTVGSILGTLLAALVLVQWIGTRATLFGIAALLLLAALVVSRVRARDNDQSVRVGEPPVGIVTLRLASVIVLVEGMSLMAMEMSSARLVAPFFGASQAVWAVIIAVVMGSIALGSWLGGRAADRRPALGALVVLLALASAAVAVLPFVAAPVMRLSSGGIDQVEAAKVVGTFLATMALLVLPVTLLGMVPPWVLRLAVPDVARTGRTAGRMYAVSTTGALIGTFASVLWLIPAIGTRRTMLVFAGALAVLVATLAPRRAVAFVPVLLVTALAFAPTGLIKPAHGLRVLDERESRYQFIQVLRDGPDRRLLQLNEGWAVHSIWNRDSALTGGYWDAFLAIPSMLDRTGTWDAPGVPERYRAIHVPNEAAYQDYWGPCGHGARREDRPHDVPPIDRGPISCVTNTATVYGSDSQLARHVLVIGNAAGTTARALGTFRCCMSVTRVELDPQVTAVSRRWFGAGGPVTAADGRPFLQRTHRRWDVIQVDAFRQPYIPFYLTTREFFEQVRGHLTKGGIVALNVGITPGDRRISDAIAATLRDVFPLVVRYRVADFNDIVVGVDDPNVTVEELRRRLESSDLARGDSPLDRAPQDRGLVSRVFSDFASNMVEVQPNADRVLTDDRAPVEWMTDRMIFGAAR
jgi:predicted membrane-bound spermidine synthase